MLSAEPTACIRSSSLSGDSRLQKHWAQSERSSPAQAKVDRRRIKELERDLRRKDKALAETAALLMVSKKLEAIFTRDENE